MNISIERLKKIILLKKGIPFHLEFNMDNANSLKYLLNQQAEKNNTEDNLINVYLDLNHNVNLTLEYLTEEDRQVFLPNLAFETTLKQLKQKLNNASDPKFKNVHVILYEHGLVLDKDDSTLQELDITRFSRLKYKFEYVVI